MRKKRYGWSRVPPSFRRAVMRYRLVGGECRKGIGWGSRCVIGPEEGQRRLLIGRPRVAEGADD